MARALELRIENEILLPVLPDSFEGLLAKVNQFGINRDFVVGHLLSSADAAVVDGEVPDQSSGQRLTSKAAAVLERVFGWRGDDIFDAQALPAPFDGGNCRTFQDAEAA